VCVCVCSKDLFFRDISLYLELQEIGEKVYFVDYCKVQGDTKKRELLKNPTKIEEIQEKKIIGRN